MKRIITLILLILLFTSCKVVKTIRNPNEKTVFILFEESNKTSKGKIINSSNHRAIKDYYYSYSFPKSEIKNFILSCSMFFSFEDALSNINKNTTFSVNKSFLKNNFIIDRKYIDKVGIDSVFRNLLTSETIFLIDKSEIKQNKIILKEAKLIYSSEE